MIDGGEKLPGVVLLGPNEGRVTLGRGTAESFLGGLTWSFKARWWTVRPPF